MSTQTVSTLFGVVLIAALGGAVAATLWPPTRRTLTDVALPLAALVAIGATAGSLYYSESAGFIPCELCWFQRIAMYPMALLLPTAALSRDRALLPYSLLLSVVGLGISLYHVQLQQFPDQSGFCDITNPCTGRWVDAFGWMTIPQMAAVCFALIAGLSALSVLTPDPDDVPA